MLDELWAWKVMQGLDLWDCIQRKIVHPISLQSVGDKNTSDLQGCFEEEGSFIASNKQRIKELGTQWNLH